MIFDMYSKHKPFYDRLITLAALLLTVLLTFGLLTGKLGLYGSHWKWVLNPNHDIPLNGLSLWITTGLIGLLGTNVVFYHLLNAVLIFISAVLIYDCLIIIGMDPTFSLASSLLFLVFPGFVQAGSAFSQTILLAGMTFGLLAIIFYQNAIQHKRKLLFLIGGISALVPVALSLETGIFVGIAGWIFFSFQTQNNNLKKHIAVVIGISHLIGAILLSILFTNARFDTSGASLTLAFKNLVSVIVLCWRKIFAFPSDSLSAILYILGIVAAVVLLFLIFRFIEQKRKTDLQEDNKYFYAAFLSLVCSTGYIVLIPLFSRTISIEYPFNDPILIAGLFTAVFLISLIKILFQKEYQYFLIALLIGFSGGARFQAVDRYARESERIRNFLAQVQVRGDHFKEGTAVLVEQLPFEYTPRESIEALMEYSLGGSMEESNAFHIIPAENATVREFLDQDGSQSVKFQIDQKEFVLNKENLLALWIPENGCVNIIDSDGVYGELPKGINLAKKYSKPDIFHVKYMSDVLQLDEFRTTIEPDYCFSALLIQRLAANAQWKEVLDEYARSDDELVNTFDFNVVKPVLMAMIEEGEFDEAVHLTLEHSQNQDQKSSLCTIWEKTISLKSSDTEVVALTEKASQQAGCQ